MEKAVKNYASYDEQSDSLYIYARDGIEVKIVELVPGVNIELDRAGQVIGIEILRASRFFRDISRSKAPALRRSYQIKEPRYVYKTNRKSKRSS